MKYLTSIWTCLALVLILVGIRVYDPLLVEQLRLNSFDQYIRSMPDSQAEGVILLNIGEESLAELGQYPFPRTNIRTNYLRPAKCKRGCDWVYILIPRRRSFQR